MSCRVLLLSPTAKPGGAERGFAALARHLPAFGYAPQALLLEHGPLEAWLREGGCPVRVIPSGRLREIPKTVGVIRAIRREIRSSSVSVVLSSHCKGHIYGGLASVAAGVPSAWWQHGMPSPNAMERLAGSIPSGVVACYSDEAVAAQRRITKGYPVVKINGGVPVDEIASRKGAGARVRSTLGWEAYPIVGIVGRLQPWKGQEVFLRAAAQVARRRPDARYVVVGGAILGWEGDYPERLERLAHALRLDKRVHFAGHQADPYPWVDALDVVVHASFGEPFGLVLVEAMALGKPLVATAAGGPTEIVENGVSGVLVPPGSPEAIAEAVVEILDREEFRSALGQQAAERAQAFSDKRMAERFAAVLDSLAGKRCPGEASARGRLHDTLDEERVVPGGPNYPEHFARYLRARETLSEPCSVLDLECGTGYGSGLLADAGHTVTGVDASATATQFARSGHGARARFLVADAGNLPFPDGCFDALTCFEVIEHMPDPAALVREAKRVLRPGGILCLSTPHARMERLHNRATRQPHWYHHVSPLTPKVLRKILRRYFGRVCLYGQSVDLGVVHLLVKSLDVRGFRLLLLPQNQRAVRSAVAPNASRAGPEFRFSRLMNRSAAMLYAEAVK